MNRKRQSGTAATFSRLVCCANVVSMRHFTKTAVFVILEHDERIFFLRRHNTGWADGKLTVPAGHVDEGQTVRQAAVTEAREEATVEIGEDDLEFVHVDFLKDHYTNFYFRAKTWTGEPKLGEPHAASEAVWISKHGLPDDLIPQLVRVFDHIETGKFFSEWTEPCEP